MEKKEKKSKSVNKTNSVKNKSSVNKKDTTPKNKSNSNKAKSSTNKAVKKVTDSNDKKKNVRTSKVDSSISKDKTNKVESKSNELIPEIKEEKEFKSEETIVIKKRFSDNFAFNLLFVTLITFSIELIFRLISKFEIVSYSTLRIFLSTFILSVIITFLSNLSPKKWIKNAINLLYIFIYSIYAYIQLGFINYLGVYISFNTSSQLGAVKDYIGDYLDSFKLIFNVVFIPFIISIIVLVLMRKLEYKKIKFNRNYFLLLIIFISTIFIYYETLVIPFMQNKIQIKSNTKLFINPDVPTVAVNQFGVTVFGILDLKSFILPVEEEYTPVEEVITHEESDSPSSVIREVSPYLNEIARNETDKKYKDLNNYFASQKVTDYNDYTGAFEGKNVVVLLLESVNDAIIDEDNFPNFTKMYNDGWHWINNYSPRNSCATGNNEFSAMTSLYSIYNTCTSNVYKNNTYFESIFGLFNQAGYRTNSFHNFVEWYYYRSTIHPNMGSGKYYGARDLGIKTASNYGEWPSDIELMDKAFDIILDSDDDRPFMTFITTVSSHQPYTNSSTYGDLYKKDFQSLGYSAPVSRYLSKLKVVDNALGLMIKKLEEKDKLNDTVIVMLADHYPYGLKKDYVKEMIKYDLGDYDIEKTPFVIYNPEMIPEEHTEYNSYINLLPTLANLMNLEYDPRLYMGTDLFSSSYESMVVFADGSWKNEIAYYNASTGKLKYYGDKTYSSEEILKINQEIDLKISMSSKAIKNNYFNYLEKKLNEYKSNNEVEETLKEEN